AAVARRVVGYLEARDRRRALLPQARAAAIESGPALGSAGCPQCLRMGMAETRRDHLPRRSAEARGARGGIRLVRHAVSRSRAISFLEAPVAGWDRRGEHGARRCGAAGG